MRTAVDTIAVTNRAGSSETAGTAAQGLFQGPSLQTESCGAGSESWSCLLSPSPSLPADQPGVVAEVGPGCRCGCVMHVGFAKPGRILATSTVSCPGRTFWLVQVNLCMHRATQRHVATACGARCGQSL